MSHQPRPVIIVTGDFVRTGGMDRANLALAEYLADHPAQASHVHLVAHRVDPDLAAHPRITFHQVPKPLGSYWLAGPLLDRSGRKLARSIPGARLIVNGGNCRSPLVSANWVHYVHAAWSPAQFAETSRPGLARRLKNSLARAAFLRQERQAFQLAPLLFANSHLTARHLIDYYHLPESKIRVVYYGTDANIFKPITPIERKTARASLNITDNRPTAIFVGSLGDARKGFDLLFQAWAGLIGRHPDKRPLLLVVGAGAALEEYRRQAAHFVESDAIRFLGFRTDVPALLAAADILISPARYEAYGLNVHEALCRGLPVLVSQSAGVAQRLVQHEPACQDLFTLPEVDDYNAITESLTRWIGDPVPFQKVAIGLGDVLRKQQWADRMENFMAYFDN